MLQKNLLKINKKTCHLLSYMLLSNKKKVLSMPRNMIHQYVKDLTSDRIASGYNHCYRVYHLAKELDDNYDDDILFAACFLHDLCGGSIPQRFLDSAIKAEQLLHEVGFAPEKINSVVESIKTHYPGGNPQLKEAKMLHDANLLDNLGAIGVIRLSIGGFLWYNLKNLSDIVNLMKEFRNKAEELYFPKARQLAKIKIKFMDALFEELKKEEKL